MFQDRLKKNLFSNDVVSQRCQILTDSNAERNCTQYKETVHSTKKLYTVQRNCTQYKETVHSTVLLGCFYLLYML